jgi:hypothetical protein
VASGVSHIHVNNLLRRQHRRPRQYDDCVPRWGE